MKITKKAAMGISFAVGTVMFATTAFAEVSNKSGYDQLKDAFKFTAESCESKLQNYTLSESIVLKDNGDIIQQSDEVIKYDFSKGATECTSTGIEGTRKMENYGYTDKSCTISYRTNDGINDPNLGIYYVNNNVNPKENNPVFHNPFKEKQAGDLEKILDAVIGNLKDAVVVNQKPDGSKELSGSLSEAQIPAIANALVSFETKSRYAGYSNPYNESLIPKITGDIYVKEVKGDAFLNKDGLIEKIVGSGVITGKDEQGKVHDLTFEVLGKLTDVNTTIVKRPDLTGKKVQENKVNGNNIMLSDPQMYVGTYKNDIIIKKDGKFQKIGVRIIDITAMDNKNVTGRYHEEYIKGNEEYSSKAKDIKFAAKFGKDPFSAEFDNTNSSGKKVKGHIYFMPNSADINFDTGEGFNPNGNLLFDMEYSRVFN